VLVLLISRLLSSNSHLVEGGLLDLSLVGVWPGLGDVQIRIAEVKSRIIQRWISQRRRNTLDIIRLGSVLLHDYVLIPRLWVLDPVVPCELLVLLAAQRHEERGLLAAATAGPS